MYKQDVIDVLGRQCTAPRCTVQPAALNDLSLSALDDGMANRCRANARSFGNCVCSFHQASILICKHSTLQVADDFIRVYRSGVITKQLLFWEETNLGNVND